jgi:outer membrane receptor protein involved in Fe transport
MGVHLRHPSRKIARVLSELLRASSIATVLVGAPAALAQPIEGATLAADIPAQPLPKALSVFSRETGLQLVYVSGVVRNQQSHPASAGMSAQEALSTMLQGTGLEFQYLTSSSVRILAAPSPKTTAKSGMVAQEEVIVTGTRLSTPEEISIGPITSVSAVEFQQTGLTRVEDALNKLPMFFASMTSTVNNGADGTATLNLRGLGSQRTLVLVDGLRLGPGSTDGRNWSDVNQIPAALVERIDVLTGGASAVYGADAVAGVVNFIINTHYQGVRVEAGYHVNRHNNNDQDGVASLVAAAGDVLPPSTVNTAAGRNVSLIMGTNFANDRGNLTGYVTYDNQDAAAQSQFDYSACPFTPTDATGLACGGSDTSRGGLFYAFSNSTTLIEHTVDPKTGVFRPYAARDVYNFAPVNYFQTPSERWTGGAFATYAFSRHADVYTSVMYMRNSMTAQSAPSGDFGLSVFVPCADPLLTTQEVATLCTPANLAANGGNYEVYNGASYPGLDMLIFRRNSEGGNRVDTYMNESMRAVLGVKGGFAGAWSYNLYAQRSTVHIDDNESNDLGNPQLAAALNVLPGAGGPVCGGQSGTAFTPNPACVPWNIWVPGAVTPASLAFMSIPSFTSGHVTEQVVSGSAMGDFARYGGKLPAAEQGLQLSLGAEWRKEQSSFVPNYEQQQGYVSGSSGAIGLVVGEFTVKELFTEMRLPLAAHRVFADDLFVDGGYRYSKYSRGFDTNTYKLGLQWAPVGAIRLRGSFQRAVRAPNISELFSLQSVSPVGDGTIDPCAGTPTASLAACQLTGVRPAQYGHIPPNSLDTSNGLTGGNPNLQPEVADTYTVGLVLQPPEPENLALSIDYFNIKIEGVIGAIGADAIMRNCLDSVGNPAQAERFCPRIHRDTQGSLWLTSSGYVSDLLVNEGELATRGIDINGSYRVPLSTAGSLLFTLVGTHLQSLQTTPVTGLGSYDCAGYFGTVCGVVTPKWRHVLNAIWSTPWHGVAVDLRWRYIGPSESAQTSPSPFLAGDPYLPLAHIPAYNYFDLNGTIDLSKNFTMRLGVNNIADKAPPLVFGSDCFPTAGGLCNGNTFPGVYDAMGRYLFVELSAQW